MNVPRKWLRTAAGAGALVAVIAALAAVTAPGASANGGFARMGGCVGPGQIASGDLAAALGVTSQDLLSAQGRAHEAALDRAVAQGWITQQQAELVKERRGSAMGMLGRGAFMGRMSERIDMDDLLAKELGITVEELDAARKKAADAALSDAVEDGRLTSEQADAMRARQALAEYLRDKGIGERTRSLYQDAVDDAVEDGVITREQADSILGGGTRLQRWGFGGRGHDFGAGSLGRGESGGAWFQAPRRGSGAAAPSTNL